MNGPDVSETTSITAMPARGACLVDGCPCKDARIVSSRRAAYFASIARLARRDGRPDRSRQTTTGDLPGFDAAA